MITAYELPQLIRLQLPELENTHGSIRPLLRLFAVINDFTDLTGKAVAQHHYLLAGRCFCTAARFYRNGDRVVRSLIRDSFMKSFRTFMPSIAEERTFVLSLMPDSLYHLYEETLNEQSE